MCNNESHTKGRLHRLPEFECLFPKTVKEAVSALEEHKDSAKVIAGGTDILNQMKRRFTAPKYLINIKDIKELKHINIVNNELHIGAASSLAEILGSPEVREKYPIIAEAAAFTATPQIRNTATMLGNLCNAVPSADSAPPLIALQARVKVVGSKGEREISAENFLVGPKKCALEPGEIAMEVIVPAPTGKGTYIKNQIRAEGDLAVVGVAVYVTFEADNRTCKDAKIAMGAVGPVPFRAKKAEEALIGKVLDKDVIENAANIAAEESKPITDIRASAWYRKEMVKVNTRRAINNILNGEKPNLII